ncbi:MAG TPA: DUF4159 domain-containing protein [Gemmataceae bacterium]|nr:DUF4159 domain-containing protein [Gemmataceae bacterium]
MSRAIALLTLFVVANAAWAQPREPLVVQVKASIAKGVSHLIKIRRGDGSWDATVDPADRTATTFAGGATALSVLALINSGPQDDATLEKGRKAAIASGLASLRRLDNPGTVYVRSLQTMAFAEALMAGEGAKGDRGRIETNAAWLIKARIFSDGEFVGWDYYLTNTTGANDASNTQYAMLGLWYARQAGVDVPREVWQKIHDFYRRRQAKDGFWTYSSSYAMKPEFFRPSVTMTVAGLCGLQIAGLELAGGREQWLPNGQARNCGVYADDDNVVRALNWIGKNFTVDAPGRVYYHLYGLERAGRLTGERFFGNHDWYREGCEFLVQRQDPDGSWRKSDQFDQWPHVNTALALLFLSKGRTPVLISKLAHGERKNRVDIVDSDWNNDRNDLRNLTGYLARGDVFGKKQVGWQIYDIRRSIEALLNKNATLSDAEESAMVADMLQSPILYLTGHGSLQGRFQDVELRLIKRYIENGGFIIAEACCGRREFDDGIKEWIKHPHLWPDASLTYLESTHPVWTCWNKITPGDPYKLMGLQVGCRTVMLYSPQDLSCYWESNRVDEGRSQVAFRLGENMVAYATGRTPPLPRLTAVHIAGAEKDATPPAKRGFFRVGQVRHSPDWQPAPKAMRNLMAHLHETLGLDVEQRTAAINFASQIRDARNKFLYMHGRGDIRLDKDKLEALRFNLQNGGLLFADACCGDDVFDKAFRKLVQELFPKEKLVQISTDPMSRDPLLYTEDSSGARVALSRSTIKCRTKASGPMEAMEPILEGIKIGGRWAVVYSKYDIGCALERNTSGDCRGYDNASALAIASAVVLYSARPTR